MMILRTVLSARLRCNGTRKSRYAPIRAHSRSKVAENENREFIEKAVRLLGGDLAKLIHKVDPRHPLMNMARYNKETIVYIATSYARAKLCGNCNWCTVQLLMHNVVFICCGVAMFCLCIVCAVQVTLNNLNSFQIVLYVCRCMRVIFLSRRANS